MPKILMVAFHFPPFSGSSGVHRTLSFCRDLPALGWAPVVVSANARAYERTSPDLLASVPQDVPVTRAFGLDTGRHLSLFGRYPDLLALPDRWVTWTAGAVAAGLWQARRHRPQVLWSTYPIATAHLAACVMHRLTGIPWVADFRDPMVEQNPRTGAWAPSNAKLRRTRLWIESLCVRFASRLVFCTEGAKRICVQRYGAAIEPRCAVIANGYDEDSFAAAEALQTDAPAPRGGAITLLHSGVIYPTPDRDPTAFFEAIAALKRAGKVSGSDLRVVLRASGHDAWFRKLIDARDCGDVVALAGSLPYKQALREMKAADGLVIFQGYTSNPAIPAKLYEYIRAGRPVFGVVDAQGDTASLIARENLGPIADIESAADIERKLETFVADLRANRAATPAESVIRRYSRKERARELADLLATVGADH